MRAVTWHGKRISLDDAPKAYENFQQKRGRHGQGRHAPVSITRWLRGGLIGASLILILAGCTPSGPSHEAADVAAQFIEAITRHDGGQACGLLTANARSSASGATDTPCAQAVLNVKENGIAIHAVQIWGDRAQVKIGSDVLFLAHFDTGWRVNDAGCKPQPGAAYACDVEG